MGMTHFLKQEHFSQFKDMTDALLCHIHFPVCMWIIDPHSRAAKNASHRNEVLPQDTTHLTQRPYYTQGSPCQDPAAIRPHEDLLTIIERFKLKWDGHVFHYQVWPKPSCKAQWKEAEDKADRRRGGKTASGNEQAWSSPSPKRAVEKRENGGNWLWSHPWCHTITAIKG